MLLFIASAPAWSPLSKTFGLLLTVKQEAQAPERPFVHPYLSPVFTLPFPALQLA